MYKFTWLLFILLITAAFVSSCKKDDTPTVPPTTLNATKYIGTLGNGAEAGVLTLNFASAPPKVAPSIINSIATIINVTGTVKIGGITINLTGTYNTDTDSLIVSGGGYNFKGKLNSSNLSGTYTGPNGDGSFTAESSTADGSVKVYTGTSHETSPDTSNHGRFLLVVKGIALTGITDYGQKVGGTISGTHLSVHFEESPAVEIAQGNVSGDGTSIQGTYSVATESGTITGTWSATLQ